MVQRWSKSSRHSRLESVEASKAGIQREVMLLQANNEELHGQLNQIQAELRSTQQELAQEQLKSQGGVWQLVSKPLIHPAELKHTRTLLQQSVRDRSQLRRHLEGLEDCIVENVPSPQSSPRRFAEVSCHLKFV